MVQKYGFGIHKTDFTINTNDFMVNMAYILQPYFYTVDKPEE